MIGLISLISEAHAQSNRDTIAYQGYLTNAQNEVLSGPKSLTFRLYDLQDGGNLLWQEVVNVNIESGYFHVNLGEYNALPGNLHQTEQLYLSLQVENEQELYPRMKVGSAVKAKWAEKATTTEVADHAVDVNGENIHPNSISIGQRLVINAQGQWVGEAIVGLKGDKGDIGPQGIQGPQGDIGPQGIQGPRGLQGLQGAAGQNADPIEIEQLLATDLLFKSDLASLLANDYANELRGPQGLQGAQGARGLQGLPGQDANNDVIKNNLMNDPNFVSTVSNDLLSNHLSLIKGPKGDQGIQGLQGLKGDKGDSGVAGANADNNLITSNLANDMLFRNNLATDLVTNHANELKGPQGPQGPQGLKGDQGIQGIQGIQGPKGDQGIQGIQGPKGDSILLETDSDQDGFKDWVEVMMGSNPYFPANKPLDLDNDGIPDQTRGPQGLQGLKGDQGIQGIQGPKGDQGIQGIQGPKGDQGIQGIQGNGCTLMPLNQQGQIIAGQMILTCDNQPAITLSVNLCGNGLVDKGEFCDDGNLIDNDGCSSKCSVDIAVTTCTNNCPVINMILIQAGSFGMGSLTVPNVYVTIQNDFYIGQSEVTVGQYRACVNAGQCTLPRDNSVTASCNWTNLVVARENHPINCLTWFQARKFAKWIGGDLPSEAQWEYVARSQGQAIKYPWGNIEPTLNTACTYANYRYYDVTSTQIISKYCSTGSSTLPANTTIAVCSIPLGNTSQGVCDMTGNVSEWTLDEYRTEFYDSPKNGLAWCNDIGTCNTNLSTERVIRGNSGTDNNIWIFARDNRAIDNQVGTVGFRVVKSIP